MLSYRTRVYSRYTTDRYEHVFRATEEDYLKSAAPIVARIRDWVPVDKNAACLDVGCGAGHVLYALKTLGFENLTGVDLSEEQVTAARRFIDNIVLSDALEYLEAHPSRFDLITAIDVIEHFTKDELFPICDALLGALRPGGILILQTPNAESPWGLQVRYGDLTHENAFSPSSLEWTLSRVGFGSFQFRECGPYSKSFRSLLRRAAWRTISASLMLWNLAECGHKGSGIYTRVFLARAEKV